MGLRAQYVTCLGTKERDADKSEAAHSVLAEGFENYIKGYV